MVEESAVAAGQGVGALHDVPFYQVGEPGVVRWSVVAACICSCLVEDLGHGLCFHV